MQEFKAEMGLNLPLVKFVILELDVFWHEPTKQRSIFVLIGEFKHSFSSSKQCFFLCIDFLNPFPQEKEHDDHDSHSVHWESNFGCNEAAFNILESVLFDTVFYNPQP